MGKWQQVIFHFFFQKKGVHGLRFSLQNVKAFLSRSVGSQSHMQILGERMTLGNTEVRHLSFS